MLIENCSQRFQKILDHFERGLKDDSKSRILFDRSQLIT